MRIDYGTDTRRVPSRHSSFSGRSGGFFDNSYQVSGMVAKSSDDGGGGMLEMRVGRLEEDMKEVKKDLKDALKGLARLEGEVSRLPGYGGIALIVGLMVGLSTAAQIAAKFIQSAPVP